MELTVVMPCLNESETIQTCVNKAYKTLQENDIDGEVLVADNGSTDGSQKLAMEAGARVIPVDQKGYGAALQGGIEAANGKFVIMGDADDSYDFTALMNYMEKLREGYDLVMGNRFKGGIEKGAMPFLHKYLGNPVLTRVGRSLFNIGDIRDFHCGLRGFRKSSIESLDLRTTGMEFASEMVIKASLHNLKITEVPTTLSIDGRTHPPHLRTWRDGWRHLRFMLLYSPSWLFLYPGFILMVLGVVFMSILASGPLHVRGISLDIHTMLYAAIFCILGFQAISFALFTRIYATSNGLLPESHTITSFFRFITLERGIIAGLCLLIGGVAVSLMAINIWGLHEFGQLNAKSTMRLVIPAATLLALGCEVIFSSFALSILRLEKRHK